MSSFLLRQVGANSCARAPAMNSSLIAASSCSLLFSSRHTMSSGSGITNKTSSSLSSGTFRLALRNHASSCCGSSTGVFSALSAPLMFAAQRFQAHAQKPGDWLCANCGENNFRFRSHCNLCSRPRATTDSSPAGSASDVAASPKGERHNLDWDCPVCKSVNFKFRSECYSCREPKPASAASHAPSAEDGGAGRGGSPSSFAPRAGDWTCNECNTVNFRSRPRCFSCRAARPANAHTARGGAATATAAAEGSSGPGGVTLRRGDFLCVACGEHNYASRTACFRCGEAKGESQIYKGGADADRNSSASREPKPAAPAGAEMMAGDWMCPSCNHINFRRRMQCMHCKMSRPAAPSAAGGESREGEGGAADEAKA